MNHIDAHTFQGLDNLEELYFDWNRLSKIEANTFHNLKKLKILDLKQNRLDEIAANGFHGLESHLEELNLGENLFTVVHTPFEATSHVKLERQSNRDDRDECVPGFGEFKEATLEWQQAKTH